MTLPNSNGQDGFFQEFFFEQASLKRSRAIEAEIMLNSKLHLSRNCQNRAIAAT